MHTTNEKILARSAERKSELEHNSRRGADAGHESGSLGDKQERANRKNSERQDFLGDGCSISGGIIRQLIKDYVDQLAYKQDESKRIEEEKKRVDEEIVQLSSRIKEFKSLLEQLEANNKT